MLPVTIPITLPSQMIPFYLLTTMYHLALLDATMLEKVL